MTSRLNQNISKYNEALESQLHMQNHSVTSHSNVHGSASTTVVVALPGPLIPHNSHKGHRRGHSYGGHCNPAPYQLTARPSNPNNTAYHGHAAATISAGTSSHSQKGHRRTLSGCLPSALGAVAWSSLRELENAHHQAVPLARNLSPEESRPSSPFADQGNVDSRQTAKLTPHTNSLERKTSAFKSYNSNECGLGPCHLECFQGLATIKFFVAILALLVTFQQGVSSGYVNSVITTIESRFEIPSRYSGIIASCYELGNVVTVLFVSYLGAKRHIPRWIAIGVLIMVVGCIVFTLPHFLTKDLEQPGSSFQGRLAHSYTIDRLHQSQFDLDSNSTNSAVSHSNNHNGTRELQLQSINAICNAANPPHYSKFISGSSRINNIDQQDLPVSFEGEKSSSNQFPFVTKKEIFSSGCSTDDEDSKNSRVPDSYGHPLILFMIAQILLGSGGSPLFTLGITYVDDHVPKESSSVYIAVIYAMAAFGPVLGFLLGAWLLLIPSNFTEIVNPDAQFIGLWWGGFLIAGALLFIICLPFLTFPKILPDSNGSIKDVDVSLEKGEKVAVTVIDERGESELKEDSRLENSDLNYGNSIKDIPRSIWRLVTNPTYVFTCLGGCMELNIVSGFIVFLPKYLETQFSMGKSQASVYTGGIAIPGACLGIFAGGYLVKKLQLKPSGAARFVVTTNCLCLVGYALFFFLGCSNPKLAGVTSPYPDTIDPYTKLLRYEPFDINLTSTCNQECSCDSSLDAQYVCGQGTTFFSPCHAGCSVNLTQCVCAGNENVTSGPCNETPCNTLAPFMIVLFFMTGTVAVTQMPLLMIVLRSVSAEERSFALGMQFVIFRLLGYIPSPIIFGNVIDSACLLWSVKRCSTLLPAVSGRCLLYDIQDFRYKYVGMLSGLKLLALALFLFDYFLLKKKEKREEKEEAAAALALEAENLRMKSSSLVSLEKLFQICDEAESVAGEKSTIDNITITENPVNTNSRSNLDNL